MSWVVDAFGEWYSTVYPHRDENEAAQLVATLASAVDLASARVLDVGCGAGRHLPRFAAGGALPTGLDLSPALLTEARTVRQEARGHWALVRGDMRTLPFAADSFDGGMSLFTSFGYFEAAEDRRVLSEAARVVRSRGFHVLDFLNRARVLAHPNPESVRRSGDYRIEERRVIADGRVRKRVRVLPAEGDEVLVEYEERVALYGSDELRQMLGAAGFRITQEWGEYDGSPFSSNSSRHIFLSERT